MRLIVIYRMDHLARTYSATTGRAVQRAMVEGSPHLHERKAGHVDALAPNGAQGVGEPGPRTRAVDARGEGPRRQPGARGGLR